MLSNLSFDRSFFVLNQPYTLPIIIPPGCDDAVIFSLKNESICDREVFLWSPKKIEFMLNILFIWDEISNIFEDINKSQVYNSEFSEVYILKIKSSYIKQFDTPIEAIVHSRLLLELAVEKINNAVISQMNYLTTYEYLEKIEVCELLLLDN